MINKIENLYDSRSLSFSILSATTNTELITEFWNWLEKQDFGVFIVDKVISKPTTEDGNWFLSIFYIEKHKHNKYNTIIIEQFPNAESMHRFMLVNDCKRVFLKANFKDLTLTYTGKDVTDK